MIIKGKVHKFGDDINTDDIISAKYLVSTDAKELGVHCMEAIKPDFTGKVGQGDIIVAGKNFGCGSSREHAPLAIKGAGIAAVVAKSFAAIFFRNAINIGLPFLELKEADSIKEEDLLEIDLAGGIIKNLSQNKVYKTQGFPEFLQEIIKAGGLMPWIRKRLASCPSHLPSHLRGATSGAILSHLVGGKVGGKGRKGWRSGK